AAGYLIRDICTYSGIESYIITDHSRKTTHKKRVVDAGFNQFLRIDSEDYDDLSSDIESKLKELFMDLLKDKKIAAIIIQDYNKGCITKSMIKFVQAECRTAKIPLIVDPKSNNFRLLSQCTAFKPNLKELSNALGRDILPEESSIQNALDELQLDSNAQFFVTLANKGIFYKKNEDSGIIHGHEVEKPDVSGAGDTVLAVIAYGLVSGLDIQAISKIANQAGAAVVSKSGVSPVNLEDIF
ncbi:MAG: hypothetical protein KJO29_09995, partial [Bacteroidia bacterium]|nr:hypothetical protein [Bacteroidia bacterium]